MALTGARRSAPLALFLLGLAVVTMTACSSGSSSGSAAVGAAPAGLSYDATAVVYLRGVPIAPNEARVTDGTVSEFTITPALPVGLDFDEDTGRISGTPGELRPQTVYVVTAKNDGGETTIDLAITVNPQAPTALDYAITEVQARIPETVGPFAPTTATGTATFSIDPALPAGLSIDADSGEIGGVPTEAIPATVFTVTFGNVTGEVTFDFTLRIRPEFDAFYEPFDDLDPQRWGEASAGGGVVSIVEGRALDLRAPTDTDAATVFYRDPIDRTRSQIWTFCLRAVDPGSLIDAISLVSLPTGTEPGVATEADIEAARRVSLAPVIEGPDPSLRFRYDPAADGDGRHWDGEPFNAFTDPGVFADAVTPIRTGPDADWLIVGIEIDATADAFRMFGYHRVGFDIGDPAQGIKLVSLSDWVPFAEFTAPLEELWLTFGDRASDGVSGIVQLEWVRLEDGPPIEGVVNARRQNPENYRLRQQSGLGTALLPSGRGVTLFEGGGRGAWDENSHRKKSILLDSDGTYYLYYEGFDELGESAIGLVTATSLDGPWTQAGGNPVVPRSVLPAGGVDYDVLTAPWVMKIDDEPNPQMVWRMFVAGEVRQTAIHRIFQLAAPGPFGPWTLVPGPRTDGSVLDESGAGDWRNDGHADPIVEWDAENSQWTMVYSGNHDGFGWSVGTATSTDLLNWTESPSNPVITANPDGVRGWTEASGNTITLTDASAFSEDDLIVVRNQSSSSAWGLTRVRRITGNVVELYHRIAGVGGDDPNRTVALVESGSITPHVLLEEENGYRLIVSVFQPFILAQGAFGDCEQVLSLTAPTIEGPWTWDHLAGPHAPLDIWNAQRSLENLAIPRGPITVGP